MFVVACERLKTASAENWCTKSDGTEYTQYFLACQLWQLDFNPLMRLF